MIILEFKIQKLVFISHINLATIRPFIEKIRVINTSKEKNQTKYGLIFVWQGRRDSNTQPTVLETATLPLSHSPK